MSSVEAIEDDPGASKIPESTYRGVDEFVLEAINRHVVNDHISVEYPPMWLNVRDGRGRRLKPAAAALILVAVILIGLFVWRLTDASRDERNDPDGSEYVLGGLAGVVPAVAICVVVRTEYLYSLMLCGASALFSGAFMGLVAATAVAPADGGRVPSDSAELGVAGAFIMFFGGTMYGYCILILGPTEYIFAHVLLLAGLFCWLCAAIDDAYFQTDDDNFLLAAVPLFIVSLLVFGIKARTYQQKPYLSHPNFFLYGVCLFLVAVGFAIPSAYRGDCAFFGGSKVTDECMVAEQLARVSRGLVVAATTFFVLQTAQSHSYNDTVLEHRYPATRSIFTSRGSLHAAWLGIWVALIASAVASACVLVGGDPNPRAPEGTQFTAIGVSMIVVGLGDLCLCVASRSNNLSGGLSVAILFQTAGFVLIGAAFVSQHNGGRTSTVADIAIAGAAIGLSGALWESAILLLHPGNYKLLSGVLNAIAFLFKLCGVSTGSDNEVSTRFDGISAVLHSLGFLVTLLLVSMAHHAWMTVNTPESTKFQQSAARRQSQRVRHEEDDQREAYDVIVVGAGPTGLTLASILGRAGLDVAVIEQRFRPVPDARFQALNPATVEMLSHNLDADLLKELRMRGMSCSMPFGALYCSGLGHSDAKVIRSCTTPPSETLRKQTHMMDNLTQSRMFGSRFSPEVAVRAMQGIQESILLKQLARFPSVKVMYGHKFVSQRSAVDANGEVIVLVDGTVLADSPDTQPTELRIRSKYLVGAGGPGCPVAESGEFRFDGFINLAKTGSILVHAPGLHKKVLSNIGGAHQYQIHRPDFGYAFAVPCDPARDLWNIPVILGPKAQKAMMNDTKTCVSEFLGTTDFDIVYKAQWWWNFFVARTFRRGNTFLAGDAAHSWPPFGGIGGNSGYGDAANLGWKLVAACRGWGSEGLLDSYDRERRQHVLQTALFVLRTTPRPALLTKFLSPRWSEGILQHWLAEMWFFRNSGIHSSNHFSQSGVQFGIKYAYSGVMAREEKAFPPADDPSSEWRPLIVAGGRLPFCPASIDCDEIDPSDQSHMFSAIANDRLTLMLISPEARTQTTDPLPMVDAVLNAFKNLSVPVRVVRVRFEQTAPKSAHTDVANLFIGVDMIVVRPDYMINWVYRSKSPTFGKSPTVIADQVVATITGRSSRADDNDVEASYARWLTREFMNNLKPYHFKFKNAIRLDCQTKPDAIAKAKERGHVLATTTKQSATGASGSSGGKAKVATAGAASNTNTKPMGPPSRPRESVVQFQDAAPQAKFTDVTSL